MALQNSAHPLSNADALLREFSIPELYNRNGFRVLELPVDASSKEVNRRKQIIEMSLANAIPSPAGAARYVPLESAPDIFAVREAAHRLADPERRLVDELFWFWPHEHGMSQSDHALQQLEQGNSDRASEIWMQQESNKSISFVSTHNLAVMNHLLALQSELQLLSDHVPDDGRMDTAQLWSRTFRRWQRLLDEEGFWSRLTSRVRDFHDERLTAATVRALRNSLPGALISINAQLALVALQKGKKEQARRLLELVQTSGFSTDSVKNGLLQVALPVRERIKALCKSAEESANADPVHADRVCSQFLDTAVPLLDSLDVLLPSGDPVRDIAHDDVAEQALGCQVVFGKKTNNWGTSVQLLERATSISSSESVSKRVRENLEVVRKNAETNDDFCAPGYHDLPAPIMKELEDARELAEGHDFDGAIGTLESLLGGDSGLVLSSTQIPIVNKALAYCLGWRAAKVRNAAFDEFQKHEPAIIRTIVERIRADKVSNISFLCAQAGEIPPSIECDCMACGTTIYGTYTILQWDFGEKKLPLLVCGAHGQQFRQQQESARNALKSSLKKSAEDFVKANVLDPENRFVQNQIKSLRDIFSQLEMSFPTSPSSVKARIRTASKATGISQVCKAARWSLGFGLFSLLFGPAGVIAILCGHKALQQIKNSEGTLTGRRIALAGLILGYVSAGLFILSILFSVFMK